MSVKFAEARIPNMYVQSMKAINMEWDADKTHIIYEALFLAISELLSESKDKNNKVACVINDAKGNFKLAGVVQFIPNENPDMPGNWSYILTFDQADTKDAKIFSSNDIYFQRVIANISYDKWGMEFNEYAYIQQMILCAIDTLTDWLDKNADPAEAKEVVLDGFFVAAVAIEKGEKVFSIIPDGALKRIIKDDNALTQ